jgi:hypothetical protein
MRMTDPGKGLPYLHDRRFGNRTSHRKLPLADDGELRDWIENYYLERDAEAASTCIAEMLDNEDGGGDQLTGKWNGGNLDGRHGDSGRMRPVLIPHIPDNNEEPTIVTFVPRTTTV